MHTGPLEMYNRFDCLECELRRLRQRQAVEETCDFGLYPGRCLCCRRSRALPASATSLAESFTLLDSNKKPRDPGNGRTRARSYAL